MNLKLPVSVLVVIHTTALDILLLERASHPGYWQSVTGSIDYPDEPLEETASREVMEETGIDVGTGRLIRWNVINSFEIMGQWRHRFAPGTTHNTEYVFSIELAKRVPVRLAPQEHLAFAWLDWRTAAERCFSWSNRDAIRMLGTGSVIR
ncbi:MAG: dihydroneopterin triphosphate diphosphatase [Betaproteobacteria bacterium]|nr:dihydroneopterin triphosphate diphosphatase [Betaproteobacteria bacterium]